MPDENGTETTRPEVVSVEESIFGDAADRADDTPAAVVEGAGRRQGRDRTGGAGEYADDARQVRRQRRLPRVLTPRTTAEAKTESQMTS